MSKKITDRMIAEAIVLAQVASDGGKRIGDIYNISTRSKKTWMDGYDSKDDEILRAIKMILSSKESAFRFYVSEGDLYNSIIVYFDWRVDGVKRQVSFHSYFGELIKFAKKSRYATRWDKGSSRQTAIEIARYYHL